MDRKGWIILLLCGAALAINFSMRPPAKPAAPVEPVKEEQVGESTGNGVAPTGEGSPATGGEAAPAQPPVEESVVELRTENAVFKFSSRGGGLKTAELLDQQTVGDENENVKINRHGGRVIGALTTGTDRYVDADYELVGSNQRSVEFAADLPNGVRVSKKWSLVADDEVGAGYRLVFELTMKNGGEQSVKMSDYGLALGTAAPLYQREWDNQTGVFYQAAEGYEFESAKWFKGGKRPTLEQEGGSLNFAGMTNQFFTTIVTAEKAYDGAFWAKRKVVELPEGAGGGTKDGVVAGISLPEETIAAGGGVQGISFDVFTGPKENKMLRSINPEFGPVMNYGFFGLISNFLNKALTWIHDNIFESMSHTWSWAFAIILLTIVIRGLMWPLQNKSTRSMKRMSLLKEPVAELKVKYADDPQKMNKEMMGLYKEYGINPLGGCLPLVVQIPIFFGFYRMLQYAVELRQEEFLWVKDLSQPDTLATIAGFPINVLPIVMAGTMLIQMSLTPKTGDKMQARIFMLMPVIFLFFCYNFASALALYWTTSNIFAIAQTMITKRLPDPELKKKKKKGPGFMEKMQARAEEMQKQKKRSGGGQPGSSPKPKKPRGPRTGG